MNQQSEEKERGQRLTDRHTARLRAHIAKNGVRTTANAIGVDRNTVARAAAGCAVYAEPHRKLVAFLRGAS